MKCLRCAARAKVRLVAHYGTEVRSVYSCFACRSRLERGLRLELVGGKRPTHVSEHYVDPPQVYDDACDCAGAPHADHCPLAPDWRRIVDQTD